MLEQGKRIGVWTQLATRTNYSTEVYDLFQQAAADMEQAGLSSAPCTSTRELKSLMSGWQKVVASAQLQILYHALCKWLSMSLKFRRLSG